MKQMTMRDRMLAVLKGEKPDRVPFAQYDNLVAPNEIVWEKIGRDNIGALLWSGVYKVAHPNCSFESKPFEKAGMRSWKTTLYTPSGNLEEEKLLEPVYDSAHIDKHFIKSIKDFEIFKTLLKDIIVLENYNLFLNNQRIVGDCGLAPVFAERTPYQQLFIQWISIEDLAFHMADYPEVVDECIELWDGIQLKMHEIICKACKTLPIPYVNIFDNITAPLTGLRNFDRYCVPTYNRFADMLSDCGKILTIHMDGDIKPLWESIGKCRIGGLESFSPVPMNDTSVAEAISMWPDKKIFLNFPSQVHLASEKEIYDQTVKILEEGAESGRIWIQISEDVPHEAWEKSFTQITKAIADFAGS